MMRFSMAPTFLFLVLGFQVVVRCFGEKEDVRDMYDPLERIPSEDRNQPFDRLLQRPSLQLKRGRISKLAVVGYLVQQSAVRVPGNAGPVELPNDPREFDPSTRMLPGAARVQLIAVVGYFELFAQQAIAIAPKSVTTSLGTLERADTDDTSTIGGEFNDFALREQEKGKLSLGFSLSLSDSTKTQFGSVRYSTVQTCFEGEGALQGDQDCVSLTFDSNGDQIMNCEVDQQTMDSINCTCSTCIADNGEIGYRVECGSSDRSLTRQGKKSSPGSPRKECFNFVGRDDFVDLVS